MTTIDKTKKVLESMGYKVEQRVRSKRDYLAIVTPKGTNRPLLLETEIAPILNGKYRASGTFSRRGEVHVGRTVVVAKDETPVRMTGFDARTFTKKAKVKDFVYQGDKIKSFHFDSVKQLEESILKGMDSNESLRELKDSVENFFQTGKFKWPSGTTRQATNALGVYLGELLSGWVALSGKTKHISGAHPLKEKATDFWLPDDPSFSGVDSFITTPKTVIGVSSKAGVGAAASYFTNVAAPAKKRSNITRTKTTLAKLASHPNPARAKEVVYDWGVNTLLKLNINQPHKLIDVVKKGEPSTDLARVIAGVQEAMKPYLNDAPARERLQHLPETLSACFNYLLAKKLEEDSLDQTLEVLGVKSFWQFNLDQTAFHKGELRFTCVKSGDAEVKLVYRKSPPRQIESRQGWVNYEIKKK